MTKSYDEFVALREDRTKNMAEVMDEAKERKLFSHMTADEIRDLHRRDYIPAIFASYALKALERQHVKTPALATT